MLIVNLVFLIFPDFESIIRLESPYSNWNMSSFVVFFNCPIRYSSICRVFLSAGSKTLQLGHFFGPVLVLVPLELKCFGHWSNPKNTKTLIFPQPFILKFGRTLLAFDQIRCFGVCVFVFLGLLQYPTRKFWKTVVP